MIKIGIIGCGYWGPNLLRNFAETRNCEIVFVFDITEKNMGKAVERYPWIKKYRGGLSYQSGLLLCC